MASVNAAIAILPKGPAPISPLRLYWALVVGGLGCFLLGKALAGAGPISTLLGLASASTCGLSWLLARALFRPDAERDVWPRVIVGSMFVTAILIQILSGAAVAPEVASPLRRVLQNINALASSTVLLLGFVEAIDGYGAASRHEKRFRWIFAAGYAGLVFVSVILLRQGGLGQTTSDLINAVCAVLAGAGATLAVGYRLRHPLSHSAPAPVQKRRAPSTTDAALAERIGRLIEAEDVYTRHDIKVADLARLAGAPEYKVSQCITGVLGFANFNRLVNHLRIELAKRQLSDPALRDRPILTIAIDCGFASIGPFNRAFKDMVGMTPSAFREGCGLAQTSTRAS